MGTQNGPGCGKTTGLAVIDAAAHGSRFDDAETALHTIRRPVVLAMVEAMRNLLDQGVLVIDSQGAVRYNRGIMDQKASEV